MGKGRSHSALLRWIKRRWLCLRYLLRPHQCGLLAAYGIGDHLIVLGFADAVARHHGLDVAVIAGHPRYAFLAGLFNPARSYAPWIHEKDDHQWAPRLEGGRFFYTHFPEMLLARRIGSENFHFLDAYRRRLGLPAGTPLSPRRLPGHAELHMAHAYLQEKGLPPGRTVILGIDASTTPTTGVGPAFWLALARALREAGLTPAVNGGPGTQPLPGIPLLKTPLSQVRPVVQAAGQICMVRSGLSDLCCDLACHRAVVYPDQPYGAGTLHGGTTFAKYGLASIPFESIVREGAWEDAIKGIVEHFCTHSGG